MREELIELKKCLVKNLYKRKPFITVLDYRKAKTYVNTMCSDNDKRWYAKYEKTNQIKACVMRLIFIDILINNQPS